MEQFVIAWLMQYIGDQLDWGQYGGLKGSSISHYLFFLFQLFIRFLGEDDNNYRWYIIRQQLKVFVVLSSRLLKPGNFSFFFCYPKSLCRDPTSSCSASKLWKGVSSRSATGEESVFFIRFRLLLSSSWRSTSSSSGSSVPIKRVKLDGYSQVER